MLLELRLDIALGRFGFDQPQRIVDGRAQIERARIQPRGPRVTQKFRDADVDALDFGLELIGQAVNKRTLLRFGRRECGAQMIEREVDVVERVAHFVCDG